jgi:hypothetical protein
MAGTATIDEPQALISTPDTQLLYMSRRSMLRLTLRRATGSAIRRPARRRR